jgi:hypothetical protein
MCINISIKFCIQNLCMYFSHEHRITLQEIRVQKLAASLYNISSPKGHFLLGALTEQG